MAINLAIPAENMEGTVLQIIRTLLTILALAMPVSATCAEVWPTVAQRNQHNFTVLRCFPRVLNQKADTARCVVEVEKGEHHTLLLVKEGAVWTIVYDYNSNSF